MRAVLMFHGVDDSGSVLSVSPKALSSIVRSIRRADHDIVPLCDLLEGRVGEDTVAITFDDGFASVAQHAAPIFRAESVPATLFLTTDYVGQTNRWPTQSPEMPTEPMMGWGEVEELMREGWSIDAHTATHPDLRMLDDEALSAELVRPRDELRRRLGRNTEIFAYPYGYYDARTVDFVGKHYRFAVTTQMGAVEAPDPLRVPRLDAYYLRSPAVHRSFGGRRFRAYLAARRTLRRTSAHPGEIT